MSISGYITYKKFKNIQTQNFINTGLLPIFTRKSSESTTKIYFKAMKVGWEETLYINFSIIDELNKICVSRFRISYFNQEDVKTYLTNILWTFCLAIVRPFHNRSNKRAIWDSLQKYKNIRGKVRERKWVGPVCYKISWLRTWTIIEFLKSESQQHLHVKHIRVIKKFSQPIID